MNGNGGVGHGITQNGQGAGTVPGTLDYYAAHGEWYPEGYTGSVNPSTAPLARPNHLVLLAIVVAYMVMK